MNPPYRKRPDRNSRPAKGPAKYPGPSKYPFRTPKPKTPQMGHGEESWGKVADWYAEHLAQGDTYHEKVILPNLLRLVDPKQGETILDVPCGEGFFARACAARGAKVLAVDIGKELVARAERTSAAGVRYFVSRSDALSMAEDNSIDQTMVILGIQNIANVDGTLAEIARTLRINGSCHIVMNHPVFRIPKRSSWGWDKMRDIEYRRLDGYLSESREDIDMHPGRTADGESSRSTASFHRPLQWYFKLLGKHGLAVDRLEEWTSHRVSTSGPRRDAENRARKEFPLFLYLRARKVSGN